MLKTIYLSVIALLICSFVKGQTYSLSELEAAFLQNNYLLVASKFNVQKADAEIVQEKLWNNPNLGISEINLWNNRTSEQLPPLLGNYGRTQQLAVELEQVIETAKKRKKRVAVKELEKNDALFDYEELMRTLKKELRQTYYELFVVFQLEEQLSGTLTLFDRLNEQYARQVKLQHIPEADGMRVRSERINLQKEQTELEAQRVALLGTIRLLTHIPDLQAENISFSNTNDLFDKAIPLDVHERAIGNNLGIKRQSNQQEIATRQLELEKAMRKPDVTFQINYDRGGNIMQDFLGVGLSFDIPVFNRNKGNIQVARFRIEEQNAQRSALEIELATKVQSLLSQLTKYRQILDSWNLDMSENHDALLENYRKHLQDKQVTLLEFIDFTQSRRESHQSILEIQKSYLNTYEELQYIIGEDF